MIEKLDQNPSFLVLALAFRLSNVNNDREFLQERAQQISVLNSKEQKQNSYIKCDRQNYNKSYVTLRLQMTSSDPQGVWALASQFCILKQFNFQGKETLEVSDKLIFQRLGCSISEC